MSTHRKTLRSLLATQLAPLSARVASWTSSSLDLRPSRRRPQMARRRRRSPSCTESWAEISGDDVSLAMDDVDADLRQRQLAEKTHAMRVVEGMHARASGFFNVHCKSTQLLLEAAKPMLENLVQAENMHWAYCDDSSESEGVRTSHTSRWPSRTRRERLQVLMHAAALGLRFVLYCTAVQRPGSSSAKLSRCVLVDCGAAHGAAA